MAYSVLVIEDRREIAELVSMHLRDASCTVQSARDGIEGLECALAGDHDLIVLDLMLPRLSGTEVCRRIRLAKRHSTILALTARADEASRLVGLESGIDDYLIKPFGIGELVEKVQLLLKKKTTAARTQGSDETIEAGDLVLHVGDRTVQLNKREILLSRLEFDLLAFLVRHPDTPFARSQLAEQVPMEEGSGQRHRITAALMRVRAKLQPDPSSPRYIVNVPGAGYMFSRAGKSGGRQ